MASKPAYPRKCDIQRAIETARSLGLDVRGYTVKPDGTISVYEVRAPANDGLEGFTERL